MRPEEVFLDDMSLDTLADGLGVRCLKMPSNPWGILDVLEELSTENLKG